MSPSVIAQATTRHPTKCGWTLIRSRHEYNFIFTRIFLCRCFKEACSQRTPAGRVSVDWNHHGAARLPQAAEHKAGPRSWSHICLLVSWSSLVHQEFTFWAASEKPDLTHWILRNQRSLYVFFAIRSPQFITFVWLWGWSMIQGLLQFPEQIWRQMPQKATLRWAVVAAVVNRRCGPKNMRFRGLFI